MKIETVIGVVIFFLFWPVIGLLAHAGDAGFYLAVGIVLIVIISAIWSGISDYGSHQGRPEDGQL